MFRKKKDKEKQKKEPKKRRNTFSKLFSKSKKTTQIVNPNDIKNIEGINYSPFLSRYKTLVVCSKDAKLPSDVDSNSDQNQIENLNSNSNSKKTEENLEKKQTSQVLNQGINSEEKTKNGKIGIDLNQVDITQLQQLTSASLLSKFFIENSSEILEKQDNFQENFLYSKFITKFDNLTQNEAKFIKNWIEIRKEEIYQIIKKFPQQTILSFLLIDLVNFFEEVSTEFGNLDPKEKKILEQKLIQSKINNESLKSDQNNNKLLNSEEKMPIIPQRPTNPNWFQEKIGKK
ncbi:hypothetical protein M0811_10938 [Anaeramoeba ignava]|uniref:Uncharacterized protein n=1 Tax=Anaeramoeba ignava TaxID=1746090 RepID=A0A9Q0R8A2_ANAIG|nr:hypothetical protein M0811_10938 [Anaeramoeba ignava]